MEQVDKYIPMPERVIDKPFLMPVEDIFSIQGRGTVVTSRIREGASPRIGERNGDRSSYTDTRQTDDERRNVQEVDRTKGAPRITLDCCCAALKKMTWSAARWFRSRALIKAVQGVQGAKCTYSRARKRAGSAPFFRDAGLSSYHQDYGQ